VFDHITLRVADIPAASNAFTAVFDELEIERSTSTPRLSVWGNFAITQTDDEHPIARRVHVAFIAPTPAHVDRFGRAGIAAGFADDGPPGPRPDYGGDYYAAFLKDSAGNSFEAVHRDGERPNGNVDHVAIRVKDVDAATAFYSTIGAAVGLTLRRRTADRAVFSVGASDGSFLVIAGEPTENVHVAFSGDDDEVRRFHADAIAAGYRSNGEPGERRRYHSGYYAAYVLDPDGNNIEVVDHAPTPLYRPNNDPDRVATFRAEHRDHVGAGFLAKTGRSLSSLARRADRSPPRPGARAASACYRGVQPEPEVSFQ
jgi:catechol 2,3-dioxygenase-like lactoylglutathione lyase family enzyme